MGSLEEEDGVVYVSVWKCFALLESPMSQARISIDCLEITALFLIALYWLLKQHKIAPPYRVVGWCNLGPTLTCWIIYAIYRFVVFLLVWCPFVEDYAPAIRMGIAQTVFHWISVTLLLAIVGIFKMDISLRRAAPGVRLPRSLKRWTYALAFFLFAYGFVRTFVAFWDHPPMNYLFYRSGYLEENVPIMVLPVFFYLAALVSIVKVAKWLGNVLANPGVYEVEVPGNLEKIENYFWEVDGWISFCRWWIGLGRLFLQLFKD